MKSKSEFRKAVLDIRNNMVSEDVVEKSIKIMKTLTATEEYSKSKTVLVYMDFRNEVKTSELIKKMLHQSKHVIIPYTDVKNTLIIPVEIKDMANDLCLCSYGYLEPKKEIIKEVEVDKIDLIIVPGVVFDKNLNRIGFGKGYYDRILNRKRKDTKAVAIAYEFQVMDEIPHEEHDKKMDMIITEEKVYD